MPPIALDSTGSIAEFYYHLFVLTFLIRLQYRIVRRGVEMLSVGGRIVYSTCSLNPIEDEAVIHRLLIETAGALKLVDGSGKLPGLNFSAGLAKWAVMSRDLRTFDTPEDIPDDLRQRLPAWLFPPKPEDATKFNLERW